MTCPTCGAPSFEFCQCVAVPTRRCNYGGTCSLPRDHPGDHEPKAGLMPDIPPERDALEVIVARVAARMPYVTFDDGTRGYAIGESDVDDVLSALSCEDALALAVALGAVEEEKRTTPVSLLPERWSHERRWVSKWEEM